MEISVGFVLVVLVPAVQLMLAEVEQNSAGIVSLGQWATALIKRDYLSLVFDEFKVHNLLFLNVLILELHVYVCCGLIFFGLFFFKPV